jgi:ribosomal protein S10
MKPCTVTIESNNFNSINKFFFFFFNKKKINFNTIKKYYVKKKKRKILTMLKSPHVNKTAQEQFEYRMYSKQLTVYSSQNFQYLVFLKEIKTHLFPDIKIKIEFQINQSIAKRVELLNPNNFQINLFKNKSKKLLKVEAKNYIKTFDTYGELKRMNAHTLG